MIILGLGSNLADRTGFLRRAVRALHSTPQLTVRRVSAVYESAAMLLPESDPEWQLPFLNLAVSIETDLSPQQLLSTVKSIEQQLGRKERTRWAPREIDIDILLWHDLQLAESTLTIPHPGLLERPFALLPLADLFGEREFPGKETALRWRRLEASEVPFGTQQSTPLFPQWVGVLNITPDSFSDGGRYLDPDAAVARAAELAAQGAAVIDIGAESTRPGGTPITAAEEWKRLQPVLAELCAARTDGAAIPLLSVDTRHADIAAQALELGADWINDVTGCSTEEMCRVLAESDAQAVIMHSLSVPVEPDNTLPLDCDPIEHISRWAEKRIAALKQAGIEPERIILDPGIGFGKTAEQSIELMRRISCLHALGVELLVGHSRKSFLTRFTAASAAGRDLETAALAVHLAKRGIDYVRVHDISSCQRAAASYLGTSPLVMW